MCYFFMMVATIIGIFRTILLILIYTFVLTVPRTFSSNIGLNIFPSDSFMSCLDSQLGYPTGKFQALGLIVFAVFRAMDQSLAFCVLLHRWKSSLKWQWVSKFDIMENNFLLFWLCFCIYLDASQYDNTLFSRTLFSYLKQCFMFYIVLRYLPLHTCSHSLDSLLV